MPESFGQNQDKTMSREELGDFPEKFKQLYDFTGPENGGFILNFLNMYYRYTNEKKQNSIKVFTHDSVINFVRLFYETLRKKILAKNPEIDDRQLNRQMAHGGDLMIGILGIEIIGNPDDSIGFIEKTGMHKADAIYDVQKYFDIYEIAIGRKVKGYND